MKTAVVTTTIHYPKNLLAIQKNAKEYGHDDVTYVVAGDLKTPKEVAFGPWTYLSIKDQEKLAPQLSEVIPFNSIQRRNYALLYAYREGADTIITVDDDNWPTEDDFIGLHQVGKEHTGIAYTFSTGWFNVCNPSFYPRGFPLKQRKFIRKWPTAVNTKNMRVVVNTGLWIGDPDIDAVTRLALGDVSYDPQLKLIKSFVLQNCWCPFNSQNTALLRDVIPAYFLSPVLERYDDIWAGYIVTTIAHHLGDVVRFGTPIVKQDRNEHDLWKDLEQERFGMQMTDEFCERLRAIKLEGKDYHTCFGEIIGGLGSWRIPEVITMLNGMKIWWSLFK